MFLAWVRYGQGPAGRYMLFLVLGERAGKVVGLIANEIPDAIIDQVRSRNKQIDSAPADLIIAWVRDLWPGYGKAYREIYISNLTIERKFPI